MNSDHLTWPIGKIVSIFIDQVDSEDDPFSIHDILVIKERSSNDFRCFEVTSECCSQSWIEHVSGVSALASHVVSVDFSPPTIDMCVNDKDYPCTHKRMYVYKIITESGVCDIELRNISNGSYNGKLEPWPHKLRIGPGTREVTEDF